MKKKRSQRFYDYSLLFTIAFLIMFGLLMIYSASSYKAQLDYNGNDRIRWFCFYDPYFTAGLSLVCEIL